MGAKPKREFSYFALALMVLGSSLGGMAQTGMNTALPSVMYDLGITTDVAQWLITVFQLMLGIVMPLVAFLLRRFSTKRLFITSSLMFSAGSVVIALAAGFPLMFLGRVLQSVAVAIMFTMVQVVVFRKFPRERWGTIMGFVGLAMGFAPNIGPTIMGVLIQTWHWRGAFWCFAAISAAIALMACLAMRKSTTQHGATGLDALSLVASTLAFGGLLLGVSNISSYGFASLQCAIPLVVGIASMVWFVHRESRISNPLLSLKPFKNRDFTLGTIMSCLLFSAFIGVTLVLPLELQSVHGRSALEAGMSLLPGTVAAFVMNPVSGILYDRIGARRVVCVGSLLLFVGTVGMLDLGNMDSLVMVMAWQAVRAFGISSLIQPLTTWSLHALDGSIVADGTSVSNAVRQIAAAFGTSIMVLLMAVGGEAGSVTAFGVDCAMVFSLACSLVLMVMSFACVKK